MLLIFAYNGPPQLMSNLYNNNVIYLNFKQSKGGISYERIKIKSLSVKIHSGSGLVQMYDYRLS